MKTLFLIISLICAISINAQTKKEVGSVFAELIVQQIDGIGFDTEKEGVNIKLIRLQGYYDYELVVMSVNKIIRTFNDITVVKSWHVYDRGYQTCLIVHDTPILVQYNSYVQMVIIGY